MEILKTLEFEDNQKVIETSLATLRETARYRDPGNGKLPLEHFEVFDSIGNIISKSNQEFNQDKVFISKAGVINPRQIEVDVRDDLESIYDTRGCIVRDIIGSFSFLGKNHMDSVSRLTLAVGYSIRGIEIAYGQRVFACSNLSIFGERYLRNFGKDAISFSRMMEILSLWLERATDIRQEDMRVFTFLDENRIDTQTKLQEVLGDLLIMATRKNNERGVTSPMNVSQVSQFAQKLLPQVQKGGEISMWDWYNSATNILTHQQTISNVHHNISQFGTYLQNKFNLN